MLGLIIDTSTKYLYLALVKDNLVLNELKKEGIKDHSGQSVYNIDLMLKHHGYEAKDLTDIFVGYGPGSYTGERISVTIAKMMAGFLPITLHKVSSLYLAGSGYDNKNVSVMFDARRGNYFSANYGENPICDLLRNGEEFLNAISNFDDLVIVKEDDFKVNPLKVIKESEIVTSVDDFVPNYLRISEAEYNLAHKND